MKNVMRGLMALTLLLSNSGFSASINLIPPGIYSYTQKGDELIDGKRASITWNVNVKNNRHAIVTISSWHAPFTCDGSYAISNEKDYVTLSWSREINVDNECDISSPQILLKKSSSGKILIRSDLFPWGNEGWQSTRKIH
ncbi:TPA: hypothetical protein R4Z70_005643 [Klebsiella variicola subsp. variicola]|uniref:hypothetical protein n=1 Tax=Klebsiella variicola TaxID=244366 RepID=UPI00115BA2EF|nr:hypothetical protein [Klebsiella variicola]GJK02838.1 hypothetical protein TUM16656_11860 [Klebsiella pneumoniae]HCA4367567.1 hypothetical protein [Klebsiella variicola subsp. variicola]EKU8544915.1 hypothetical protein [Klebsiella variicola]MBR7397903.1 hypothetical protein [Klebsiella variicola]GJK26752.1 hypothetical protein TUM17555_44270 [Klebsiella pneumoniae]